MRGRTSQPRHELHVVIRHTRLTAFTLIICAACANVIGADFEDKHLREPRGQSGAGGDGDRPDSAGTSGEDPAGSNADAGSSSDSRHPIQRVGDASWVRPAIGSLMHPTGTGGTPSTSSAGAAGTASTAGAAGSPNCSHDPLWQTAEDPGNDATKIAARSLFRGTGIALRGDTACVGAKVSNDLMLFVDCDVAVDDKVHPIDDLDKSQEPASDDDRVTYSEAAGRFRLVALNSDRTGPVAWSARAPVPGETATLIGFDSRRSPHFARLQVDPDAFQADPWQDKLADGAGDSSVSLLFGSDNRLIGFCPVLPCDGPSRCAAMRDIRQHWSALSTLASMQPLLWGDVDGDGQADGVAIERFYVEVRRSYGSQLGDAERWYDWGGENGYVGVEQNALGDVTGDGKADLVCVGNGIQLLASNGASFEAPVTVSAEFTRCDALKIGDVDGDRAGDIVVIQGSDLLTITNAASVHPMTTAYPTTVHPGLLNLEVTDVTGDGLADVILAYPKEVWVLPGARSGFGTATVWLHDMGMVPPGWFFSDVSGDGMSDAIRITPSGSVVYLSNGHQFLAPETAWSQISIGEHGNYFADLTGDGRADQILQERKSLSCAPSTGHTFWSTKQWLDYGWFGSRIGTAD